MNPHTHDQFAEVREQKKGGDWELGWWDQDMKLGTWRR